MQKFKFVTAFLFLTILKLEAIDSSYKFEGLFGSPVENINNLNQHAQSFLPYNAVIVEVGAYRGEGTIQLSGAYPYGKIYAFEPLPDNYSVLINRAGQCKNVSLCNLALSTSDNMIRLWGDGSQASLFSQEKEGEKWIEVPCILLDKWCKLNDIDHIDFLRLDIGGCEWQIINSSPEILKTVIVLVIKTHIQPSNPSIPSYNVIKKSLDDLGFELFSHWYQEGNEGEATFVRKYMYDSIFR